MNLKNSLYTISAAKQRESLPSFDITLNAAHTIYQAHFPGQPITPGVCIIQIAKELLEEHLGRPLLIRAIKNVKFVGIISPVDTPEVTYHFDKIENIATGIKSQVTVLHGETELTKISFTCIERFEH